MIEVRDLNGKEVLKAQNVKSLKLSELLELVRQAKGEERTSKLYFMDIEHDVSEISDQDDWDYAKSQAEELEKLMLVVVPANSELQGTALTEAIEGAIKKQLPETAEPTSPRVPETRPFEHPKTDKPQEAAKPAPQLDIKTESQPEAKPEPVPEEPAKTVPISTPVFQDSLTPAPEMPEGINELSNLLTTLGTTVQSNMRELAKSLSPSEPAQPNTPTTPPPVARKNSTDLKKASLTCVNCKQAIVAKRFKCMVCPTYDLCATCEVFVNHPHTMIRFTDPEEERTVGQLGRIYQLKARLLELTDMDMRRSIIRKVTNEQYPDEFYDQFLLKNQKLTFGEFVNKVVSIFE